MENTCPNCKKSLSIKRYGRFCIGCSKLMQRIVDEEMEKLDKILVDNKKKYGYI